MEEQGTGRLVDMLRNKGLASKDDGALSARGTRERYPQVSLAVCFRDGRRDSFPYSDLVRHRLLSSGDREFFVELVFREFNILLFGRGMGTLYPLFNDHAITDISEEVDPDDEESPFYIERILLERYAGQSVFMDAVVPQGEFRRLIGSAEVSPDFLESRERGD